MRTEDAKMLDHPWFQPINFKPYIEAFEAAGHPYTWLDLAMLTYKEVFTERDDEERDLVDDYLTALKADAHIAGMSEDIWEQMLRDIAWFACLMFMRQCVLNGEVDARLWEIKLHSVRLGAKINPCALGLWQNWRVVNE